MYTYIYIRIVRGFAVVAAAGLAACYCYGLRLCCVKLYCERRACCIRF